MYARIEKYKRVVYSGSPCLCYESEDVRVSDESIIPIMLQDEPIRVTFYDDNFAEEDIEAAQSIHFGTRLGIDTTLLACRGGSNSGRLQEYKELGYEYVSLIGEGIFKPMKPNDITSDEYLRKIEKLNLIGEIAHSVRESEMDFNFPEGNKGEYQEGFVSGFSVAYKSILLKLLESRKKVKDSSIKAPRKK